MRKFLLSFVLCFSLLFSLSLAVTIDLSDYGLPDLDTGSDSDVYSNYVVGQYSNNAYFTAFSSSNLTADSSHFYGPVGSFYTMYDLVGDTWSQNSFDVGVEIESNDDIFGYSSIITGNYIVYDNEDNSVIIYQPTQEGGENMSTVLTDLTTVMTAVLSNATSLVTWITNNPLVYLWVIMAIIIAIIAFVRGFIRGV